MFRHFYTKFIESRSTDPEIENREVVLNWLLLGSIGLMLAYFFNSLVSVFFRQKDYLTTRIVVIVGVILFLLALYYLARYKQRQVIAGFVLVSLFFLSATFVVYTWGILNPTGIAMFALTIVMAGILLNTRFSLYTALAIAIILAGLEYGKAHGYIQPDLAWMEHPSTMSDVGNFTFIFAVIGLISWLFNRQMELSLIRARRSETALKKQKDLLEIKVQQRTRELQAAQLEKMQQFYRFAELGHLSTALFHDLANQLATVSVDIAGLKRKDKSVLAKRIETNVHYIDTVVQQVRHQIQGKSTIETFDVVEEIKELLKILSFSARKASVNIELETTGDKSSILYKGNLTRFRQLVINLLNNGIEAYGEAAAVNNKDKRVVIKLENTKQGLRLSIIDYGVGIEPELQTKIFEPFYTTKEKGVGIGLFIVRQVIEEDFNGTLKVVSSKEEGTIFTVTLPRRQRAAHKKATR